MLNNALVGDETNNFEFSLITKAGVQTEVVLNATTRRDEQGTVIGVVGICQDITACLAQEWKYFKLTKHRQCANILQGHAGCRERGEPVRDALCGVQHQRGHGEEPPDQYGKCSHLQCQNLWSCQPRAAS
jgi:hypothetical protein